MCRPLALVQDRFHLHPSLVCVKERLCYGRRGEGVCLDEDLRGSAADFFDDDAGAVSAGREANGLDIGLEGEDGTLYQDERKDRKNK